MLVEGHSRTVWKHLKTRVLQRFANYVPGIPIDALKEQVEDGMDRAEAAVGVLHAALLADFKTEYGRAVGTEREGPSGYEWLDTQMGTYQKALLRKCSPELEPWFGY